jgi:hypothetical protein
MATGTTGAAGIGSDSQALAAAEQARKMTDEAAATSALLQGQSSADNILKTAISGVTQQDGNTQVQIASTSTQANSERQKSVARTLEALARLQ